VYISQAELSYRSLGPNFIFEVKSNVSIREDEFIKTIVYRCTLQCQPRIGSLICLTQNFSSQTLWHKTSGQLIDLTENTDDDVSPQMFSLILNKSNVPSEPIHLPTSKFISRNNSIIEDMFDVFNAIAIMADKSYGEAQKLREDLYLSELQEWDYTQEGICRFRYRFTHGKDKCDPAKSYEIYFTLPQFVHLRIRTNISMEMTREYCFYEDEYGQIQEQEMKVSMHFPLFRC